MDFLSLGILDIEETATGSVVRYRVLTSWYDKIAVRDYRVTVSRDGDGKRLDVRPLGAPMRACGDRQVSLPIMSRDGRELAARDEWTATTKLFALDDDGGCTELMDLGLPTGKVAFDVDGGRIAFAIPRGVIRDGTNRPYFGMMGRDGREAHEVFVLDRKRLALSKVAGSEDANRLAFPEFVGEESIAFLMAPDTDGEGSRFRFAANSGRDG